MVTVKDDLTGRLGLEVPADGSYEIRDKRPSTVWFTDLDQGQIRIGYYNMKRDKLVPVRLGDNIPLDAYEYVITDNANGGRKVTFRRG